MNHHINTISNRLSLRSPQRDSLEILARICEIIPLEKDTDLNQAIGTIKSEFPSVEDFERNFPSLCFALATGVGKTRLMGAFISYLYLAEGIRHFFVLAPNLTIYNKLIADFTPNTPKYVFRGIAEFAQNAPEIITGDTYEDGRGVRKGVLFDTSHIHVNIFNISKINAEVRGDKAPRIKRLSEYIGESYFEYLSKLDDLVLLMDEAHRYRASAGINAINELNPIMGIELTATPQVERGSQPVLFKNVIYSYPLHKAMEDGFVKEPAVATRENFDAKNYDQDGLEKLKLEDGVRIHENTKVELEVYARENDTSIVKPFMLVVAQNTDHAESLVRLIEDESFFEGRYKGKVITVHSNQRGEEKDETIEQLLNVENPNNPIEIVVHVNMLKEGWDVTNLYTIVPLRAANSKTLVEQSIGRGLRLPYGKRTGNPNVDRLTIVSHDRFQEIIDEANRPDSIIRTGIIIGKDIPDQQSTVINVESELVNVIKGESGRKDAKFVFEDSKQQHVALTTLEVLREFEKCSGTDLTKPETQKQISKRVKEIIAPTQMEFEEITGTVDVEKVVAQTIELRNNLSIDIPKIIIVPTGDIECGYEDFDLDTNSVNLQPVDHDILIQHLQNHERYRLSSGNGVVEEKRLEDYLVRGLIDFDDISYDDHSELLYKLAGQIIEKLKSYLRKEDDVKNVLQYHQKSLVNLIHSQMQGHYYEKVTGYEAHVSRGFISLKPAVYSASKDEPVRNFRTPVDDRQNIRSMLFGGFEKSLYPIVKFDSDPERRFAVMLENEADVVKWTKPAKGLFRIHYNTETEYEPDFIVETKTTKYLCEPKRASEIQDEIVLAKTKAASEWCKHASEYEKQNSGKPWKYLLIPHDVISENMTLLGFEQMYLAQ
ncbi:MAG: DEAD/DEAH box helicase family protein [Sedimentisphaerales bacterium]|nr:DEAD/DEAH box helicase family protein [Sedimentisphaerales bacterium]